jgi:hypothetical protein
MNWTPETERDLPQPWSREQCRDRYVRGERIGLRTLQDLSGRGLSTLGEWSKAEDWTGQRERFHDERRTRTDELIIEKSAESISDELAAIAATHYESYKGLREHAETLVRSTVDPELLNALSLIVDRSIKGEREARGMKFQDINEAIKAVRRAGLEVVDRVLYAQFIAAGFGGEDSSTDDYDPSELVEVGLTPETA